MHSTIKLPNFSGLFARGSFGETELDLKKKKKHANLRNDYYANGTWMEAGKNQNKNR